MLQSTKLKGVGDQSKEHFDIRHGDEEFKICPACFWSCFGPVFPHYAPFPTFWNGNVYPVQLYVYDLEVCNLVFFIL